jgi:hypothetical protein
VRRTASSLAKSLSEFGDMLDRLQVQAGQARLAALQIFGDNIERAANVTARQLGRPPATIWATAVAQRRPTLKA